MKCFRVIFTAERTTEESSNDGNSTKSASVASSRTSWVTQDTLQAVQKQVMSQILQLSQQHPSILKPNKKVKTIQINVSRTSVLGFIDQRRYMEISSKGHYGFSVKETSSNYKLGLNACVLKCFFHNNRRAVVNWANCTFLTWIVLRYVFLSLPLHPSR